MTTDVKLSGKVATMGQGVLQDVSRRLVETFAANLAAMLEGEPEAAPAEGAEAPGSTPAPAEMASVPEIAAAASTAAAPAPGESPPSGQAAAGRRQLGAPGEEAPAPGGEAARGPEARRPAPEPAEALDLGSLGGAVLLDRLKDPRVLAGLVAVAFLLGRWSKRG